VADSGLSLVPAGDGAYQPVSPISG
jgi:hypothetical protein